MVEDIVATSAREGGPVSYSSSSGFRPKIIQIIEDIQKNMSLVDIAEFYTTILSPSATLLFYVKSSSITKLIEQLSKLVETHQKGD